MLVNLNPGCADDGPICYIVGTNLKDQQLQQHQGGGGSSCWYRHHDGWCVPFNVQKCKKVVWSYKYDESFYNSSSRSCDVPITPADISPMKDTK